MDSINHPVPTAYVKIADRFSHHTKVLPIKVEHLYYFTFIRDSRKSVPYGVGVVSLWRGSDEPIAWEW